MGTKYSIDLKSQAILVDFDGGFFNWVRRDQRVERDVASQYNVSKNAGHYNKNLFLGADSPLCAIRTIVCAARKMHELKTVPWEPQRNLLLNTNYMGYMQEFSKHRNDLELAKAELDKAYDTMIQSARSYLGPMWRQEDYPRKGLVLDSCYITVKHYAVADATDVRLQIDDSTVSAIQEEVTRNAEEQFEKAVESVWQRLYDVVEAANRNLHKASTAGDRFHVGWFSQMAELIPALSGLNLSNDPRLNTLAERCKYLVTGVTAEDYQISKTTRAAAADISQKIYDELSSIYKPKEKES